MARLTNKDYIQRHQFLARMWRDWRDLFAVVSTNQQWDVHSYYQPSKDWSEAQLLEHRAHVTAADRSLPNRASKPARHMIKVYFAAKAKANGDDQLMGRLIRSAASFMTTPPAPGKKPIRIATVAQPELDTERLAAALLAIVNEMSPEQRAKFDNERRHQSDGKKAA